MKKVISIFLVIVLLSSLSLSVVEASESSIVLPKVGALSDKYGGVTSIDFSHDDRYIVTGHYYGEVAIWDSKNMNMVYKFKASDNTIQKVIYNHDSTKIVTSDTRATMKIWDVNSGGLIKKLVVDDGREINDIVLNEDSSILYSANQYQKTVSLWDMNTGDLIQDINFTSDPKSIDYNPIDNHIAIMTYDGSLNIRDGSDGSYILTIPIEESRRRIKKIMYTNDYKTLIIANGSYFTRLTPVLFDVKNDYKKIKLNNEDYKEKKGENYEDVYWEDIDITPNDKYLITGSSSSGSSYDIFIFDNTSRKLLTKLRGGGPFKFNNSGDRLLAGEVLYDTSQLPERETIGIEITTGSKTMKTDETQDIGVNEVFNDGTSEELNLSDVSFTNKNPEIAEVIYGRLNSYEEGTAIIKAEYRGFEYELEIKVQNYEVLDKEYNVPVNKTWDIIFNMDVDIKTIKEKNIYITDKDQNILPMLYYFEKGEETIIKLIPVKHYNSGENYTIWVKEVESKSGSKLKRYTKKEFEIK